MEYITEAIGTTVRRLRKEKGMSQELLSGLAGIARTHLTMIESGAKHANFETLWKLAVALEMRPSELVFEIEKEYSALKSKECPSG